MRAVARSLQSGLDRRHGSAHALLQRPAPRQFTSGHPATPSQQRQQSPASPSFSPERRHRDASVSVAAGSTVEAASEADANLSRFARDVIQYALNLARVSQNFEVHSWMLVLGMLKQKGSYACQVLQQLGLDDLEGAWNEVLWALHVCDGLKARPGASEISFADKAYRVIMASSRFAGWRGSKLVESQDLLLALCAGQVLESLFPDLDLSFDNVRAAVEKHTGVKYSLPKDTPAADGDAPRKDDDEPAIF